MKVTVWTLTVDHPDDGIITTVHPDEAGCLRELDDLWVQAGLSGATPAGVVQSLCDNGYVIYINEHKVEVREEPN